MTIVVQRDAHLQDPVVQHSAPSSPKKEKLMSRFFSSPKKNAARKEREETPIAAPAAHPLVSYMNREGALGRASLVFEKVAPQCLGKCAVFDLPVSGVSEPAPSLSSARNVNLQRTDFDRNFTRPRGVLRLKMFYLPPMPSIPRNAFPENLHECIKGMQIAAVKSDDVKYEGILTQLGGDCMVSDALVRT